MLHVGQSEGGSEMAELTREYMVVDQDGRGPNTTGRMFTSIEEVEEHFEWNRTVRLPAMEALAFAEKAKEDADPRGIGYTTTWDRVAYARALKAKYRILTREVTEWTEVEE
jgi:hypothetical protein